MNAFDSVISRRVFFRSSKDLMLVKHPWVFQSFNCVDFG